MQHFGEVCVSNWVEAAPGEACSNYSTPGLLIQHLMVNMPSGEVTDGGNRREGDAELCWLSETMNTKGNRSVGSTDLETHSIYTRFTQHGLPGRDTGEIHEMSTEYMVNS